MAAMTVLITGATSGIGECFARALHAQGHRIIVVGRNREKLALLKKELGAQTIEADLSTPEGVKKCMSKDIDMLINNAGLGYFGTTTSEQDKEMVNVNIHALTQLSNHYLAREKPMKTIINVASVVAFFPMPSLNTYAATKAYVLHYTIGLAKAHPSVMIQCLCPGATNTQFFSRATGGRDAAGGGSSGRETPEEVVRNSLEGLKKKKTVVISGLKNAMMVKASGMASKEFLASVLADYPN